jgi:putative transposase
MDFMQDVLVDGRRFRTLNVLDRVTRECLALEVDTSLPGQRVTRLLDQLVAWQGAPKQITVDNGPEFAGQVLDAWAYAHGVTLDFIAPGKPTQNAHIESFNGKFRDECLDLLWICTGSAVSPTRAWLFKRGRRSTTPSGRIAPYGSKPQRPSPSH